MKKAEKSFIFLYDHLVHLSEQREPCVCVGLLVFLTSRAPKTYHELFHKSQNHKIFLFKTMEKLFYILHTNPFHRIVANRLIKQKSHSYQITNELGLQILKTWCRADPEVISVQYYNDISRRGRRDFVIKVEKSESGRTVPTVFVCLSQWFVSSEP